MTTPKYKHFKFEDRYVIQEFLRLNYSFTAIANRLKKDRRAVSKEILKRRFLKVGANKRKLDCTKPDKPPYVCNGCLNKTSCKQNQYIYEASIAQNEYEKTLRQERSRLQVSKETIAAINDIIVPLMTEKASQCKPRLCRSSGTPSYVQVHLLQVHRLRYSECKEY